MWEYPDSWLHPGIISFIKWPKMSLKIFDWKNFHHKIAVATDVRCSYSLCKANEFAFVPNQTISDAVDAE